MNQYGHVQRMNEERLPRIILWFRPGRRRRRKGRPRNSWKQEVTVMREKGTNNMEWIDREEWRRKIKL